MYPKQKYSIVDGSSGSDSPRASLSPERAQDFAAAPRLCSGKGRDRIGRFLSFNAPWFVSALLALTNLLLLVALLKQYVPRRPAQQFSWMPPEIETTSLFELKPLYGEGLNNESEAAWNELMPVGRGFVVVKNHTAIPDQPGLDQSVSEQKAMVSVFHQLHCLYMTREGYYSALEGRTDQVSPAHLLHCFDYLRQTIMCFGDTTLEWLPAPPRDNGSTGWGFEHKCRNFDAISHWVEDNRLKTTHGIH
ncbi:hypothetical protein ISF_01652 [Cordyceps fumosorosea ARSEF 2679]|uniref:Tat pathway signal sequence n=1 Tax=Cordyceps fumosorosea (strain ARSEF 2679) TaxID=1081104 RepID=A0A162MYA2_CORFA|nr:hypothetical protein ISF_01652 [Cordyceps fumosorosea ARSEF 2679]OAA72579.1 hypothetical protein ISF_01652 [Cordyceps fumosorosea ARSEF 2679]